MIILGIETSCDETALALIETRMGDDGLECKVIASLVHSQAELHSAYGGVYPSLAKREHGKNLTPLLHKLLIESGEFIETRDEINDNEYKAALEKFKTEIGPQNPELYESFVGAVFLKKVPKIDVIAVTEGPGLEPALWVGINFARMLGSLWSIPVTPINHMEGHVVGSLLPSDITNGTWHKLHQPGLPAIAFLISGGHTEIIEVGSIGDYKIIGETQDDAVGEAFDKVARLLGLPYPGGPYLSKLAHEEREKSVEPPVKLPRPMINSGDLNFSFSGLKTAVLYALTKDEKGSPGMAREFEDAVTETLDRKLRAAIDKTGAQSIIIGGGVAANHHIRVAFQATAKEYGVELLMPSRHISGDNALMIALAAAFKDHTVRSAVPLRAHGTKRLSE